MNTNVTNRRTEGKLTDALLILDCGLPTQQSFQGRITGLNGLVFEGVPINPPGRTRSRTVRVTNIRANPAGLGIPTGTAEFPEPEVRAAISIRGPAPVVVMSSVVLLGSPLLGLVLRMRGPNDAEGRLPNMFQDAADRNEALAADPTRTDAVSHVSIRFKEGYADAFRTASREAAKTGATAKALVTGTRFLVRFYGVPDHVQVFVTTRDMIPVSVERSAAVAVKAVLVSGTDSNGGGGVVPAPGVVPVGTGGSTVGVPIDRVRVSGGFGLAVWEWVSNDPNSPVTVEDVTFAILFAAERGHKPKGFIRMSGSLAPISTVTTSSDVSVPVPRFIDTGSTRTVFALTGERTPGA